MKRPKIIERCYLRLNQFAFIGAGRRPNSGPSALDSVDVTKKAAFILAHDVVKLDSD